MLSSLSLREASTVTVASATVALSTDWQLVAWGEGLERLEGERTTSDGQAMVVGPANHFNLEWLRFRLPWLVPKLLGTNRSAGFGDRLGLATAGHVRALRSAGRGVAPIFAQQSIREMTRSGRTPTAVLDDAAWGVFAEGWRSGFGADADHLKTEADVDPCAAAGFTFYTVDPGEHVWAGADSASPSEVEAAVTALPWADLEDSSSAMRTRHDMSTEMLMRAAAKYGRAVAHIVRMDRHIGSRLGPTYEIEISVDETESPTTPEQHRYLATELRRLRVRFVSLAPRFVGRFEKGIDYIGDIGEFKAQYARHAEIALDLGPYKLSLHSGSEKFSIYESAVRLAGGVVHLKTSGTSWLEALRTVGQVNAGFMAEIYAFALDRYPDDRALYHVSTDPEAAPALPDLDDPKVRQVLHVTFGSVIQRYGPAFLALLHTHREQYELAIERHFARHLAPFQVTPYT